MHDRQSHKTFGTADVFGSPTTFDRHHILDRGTSVFIDYLELRSVTLRLGWGDATLPICGKCRSPMRPVVRADGATVWLAEVDDEWTPCCEPTPSEGDTSVDELVAAIWHEPDRSVGSWCQSATIHIDDSSGQLSFVVRTCNERVEVQFTCSATGEVQLATSQRRRRRRRNRDEGAVDSAT